MVNAPNVVLCTCDQLRAFEVGCYGNEVVRTPHIDRLASQGTRFELAATNNPVCMPARSCLLTGQFSRTCTGFLDHLKPGYWEDPNIDWAYPLQERTWLRDTTVAEALRAQGYETALFGKWHVHPAPHLVGFDSALFPRVHHRHTGQTFIENTGLGEVVEGFSVDFEAERVGAFLKAKHERPFFMFYNISPPHMPLADAPEKYLNMYGPDEVPLRPNVYIDGELPWNEHLFKIYLWDFLYYEQHLPYTEYLPENFDLRHLVALYYGLTTWVDDTVGRLLNGIETSGLADNTIVVFLSDHGDNLGSQHRFNKMLLIEESIRIPMIFRSGHGSKVNSTQVAQTIDVMPTILDLCGASVPTSVQGRSLAPILRGECAELAENGAFIETTRCEIGLRTSTHLYGRVLDGDLRSFAAEGGQFYDLRDDPYQQHNLFGSGADPEEDLQERLAEWNAQTRWQA